MAAASSTAFTTAGAPHINVTPCSSTRRRISAPSTLRSTTCVRAHRRSIGVRHAPAVAVEHRQRVQVHVAVGHADVPAERHRVDPQVAVGQLHALGARGGAARVVDRWRWRPRRRRHGRGSALVAADSSSSARAPSTKRCSASSRRRARRARDRRAAPRRRSAPRCSGPRSAPSRKLIGTSTRPLARTPRRSAAKQPGASCAPDDRHPLAGRPMPSASRPAACARAVGGRPRGRSASPTTAPADPARRSPRTRSG